MTAKMKIQNNEQGSVFFYIMLAIVLLAALSFAVSRGNRGNVGVITDQQAKLAAQEIIDYGNTVANAVQKLRLRGCVDSEIDAGNTAYKTQGGILIQADGHNSNAPTDGSCSIYKSEGGNVNPVILPESYNVKWSAGPGNSAYGVINVRRSALPGIGEENNEEMILVGVYITEEICLKINELLSVENPSGNLPTTTRISISYGGIYLDDGTYKFLDDDSVLSGKEEFCSQSSSGNAHDNAYIKTLIAR